MVVPPNHSQDRRKKTMEYEHVYFFTAVVVFWELLIYICLHKPRVLSPLCSLRIRNEVDLVPLACEDDLFASLCPINNLKGTGLPELNQY